MPPTLLWLGILIAGAFWTVQWFRVGRDPKRGTVIPIFSPPGGMSPAALNFIYRGGGAEDVAVNASALGALAELVRRKLVRIEESNGKSSIVRGEGNAEGLQPDMVAFNDALLPPGKQVADWADFEFAARVLSGTLLRQVTKWLPHMPLKEVLIGIGILVVTVIVALVAISNVYRQDDPGLSLGAGFVVAILLVAALVMRRSHIRKQKLIAWALMAVSVLGALAFAIVQAALISGPDGLPRVLTHLGLFLVMPAIVVAVSLLLAVSPEARRFIDEIEGFRMFIGVADAGRHAIDNAPDPTEDSLSRLAPYAIALHVEAGWVNALADALPVRQAASAVKKRAIAALARSRQA